MTRKALERALEPASNALGELATKESHSEFVDGIDSVIEELAKLKDISLELCQTTTV